MKLFRPITQTVMAVQWDGTNDVEIREVLPDDVPFPPLGTWVIVRAGGVSTLSPAEFASQYTPAYDF